MQKGFVGVVILIVILISGGLGAAYYFGKLPVKPAFREPKVCTQEAKICPDGSSVGRTGPNCEFTVCPSVKPGMANPASVNCEQKGGHLEIRTDPGGGQTGICKFSDGTECEEWAYMKNTCQPGKIKTSDETANWKTYTNPLGFSFKYPLDWQINARENPILLQSPTNFALEIFYKLKKDIKSIVVSDTHLGDIANRGTVVFGNQTIEKDVRVYQGEDKIIFYNKGSEIEASDLVFSLILTNLRSDAAGFPTLDQQTEDQADKILSTFKFLP